MTASGAAAPARDPLPFGDPASVDAAHRTIRADPTIQFDLPWREVKADPPPRWLTELFRAIERFVDWVGGGWHVLMWLAIGAIVLTLAILLFPPLKRWIGDRIGRPGPVAAAADWTPQEGAARALLDEADRLAAQGDYAQAVRLILHRSIEDIEAWRGDRLRPSLTGRDIAAFDGLPDAARGIFARFVAQVEASLFAGGALGHDDWTRARADYAGFALGRDR
jgi:hypothetical protein